MVAITNTTSLTFLKEEIDTELAQAEAGLEAYVGDNDRVKEVEYCATCFGQLRGIFQLLELSGAALMAEEMEMVAAGLKDSRRPEAEANALSGAIVMLGRYLEYIQLKNKAIPELVVGAINDLRRAAGRGMIPESHFFRIDLARDRYPEAPQSNTPAEQIPAACRRLRHMYQVGLLGALRDKGGSASLKLMSRSLDRLDKLCGPVTMSRFFWVAHGAVEAMLHDKMALTPSRCHLLSLYDRQMKRIVQEGSQVLGAEVPLGLIKESVYIVSLSSTAKGIIGEIKQAFDLRPGLTDEDLQKELGLMAGSETSVLRSVAEGLKEELGILKNNLDLIAQGVADTDYGEIADILNRMAGTLSMVGGQKEADLIRERALEVAKWTPEAVDAETADFQTLVEELLRVENAIASLERRFEPEDEMHRESQNPAISMYQLGEAKTTVVGECRSGLSLVKRSLGSFVESNWDVMHLANVPSVMAGVSGGLTFLDLDRARAVIEGSRDYIEQTLLPSGAAEPTLEAMETLADAITSVDYYLESMEEHKPIGETVLEVAEESLEELGFAVVRPVSA